jgi:hypothetical protein
MPKLKQAKKAEYQNFVKQFDTLMQEFNATIREYPYETALTEYQINTMFGGLTLSITTPESELSKTFSVWGMFENYSEELNSKLGVDRCCKWNCYLPDDWTVDDCLDELKRRFECLKIK